MAVDDILDQDEIDSLLGGPAKKEEVVPEEVHDPSEPRHYDFSSQERIVRGRMPTLETISERFARNLRASFHQMTRSEAETTFTGISIQKHSDYLRSLYVPTALNIVKMHPLRGVSSIIFDAKLVFSLVEIFFGGEGKYYTRIEGRDFTPTEERIISILLDCCFRDLEDAWSNIKELALSKVGFEVNPAMANVISSAEVLIIAKFKVELETGSGEVHVSIPYSSLEPIREILDSAIKTEQKDSDERWMNALREEILDAPVRLSSILAERNMSLRTLKQLKSGDVFHIDIPDKLKLYANGMPIFQCMLGEHEGRVSLQITDKFNQNKN